MTLHRKDFLKLLGVGAATGLQSKRPLAAAQTATRQSKSAEEFAARVMEDVGTAWRGALCYVGDRLGIYKAMAAAGPVTASALAQKTTLNARMLREWLNAMATAGYVEYQPAGGTYFLTAAQASVLADEESSPLFRGGMLEMLVPMVAAANKVAGAFRTGQPITMADFAPELFEGEERDSAPLFKHQLVQQWIAAMPDVEARLRDGGAAVDIGCGTGLASITLATAFPKAHCFGYDPFGPSIERARANAAKAGVAGRVEFVVADASALPAASFDLATIFDSVHHFSDPVGSLVSARKALTPGGTCFILDLAMSPHVEENRNTMGRIIYAATTIWCLQDSMANNGAGIGAEMTEALMRELARRSGFSQFRRLPAAGPAEGVYQLKV